MPPPKRLSELSDAEFLAYQDELARLKLYESPAHFAQSLTLIGEVLEPWRPYRHLMLLNQKIMDLMNPEHPSRRLLVTMPPQHGKSMLSSLYFPAWFLFTNPTKRVMICSYGDDYAAEWGGKVRDLLVRNQHILGVPINRKSQAADRWDIEGTAGGCKTAGVGGQITGRGAHLMVVDDPFKDAEEADSPTIREKRWLWWNSTAQSRLRDGAVVMLIQTRWHEDDLAGRVLLHEPERWTTINLPAIAEDTDDALGRTPGDALCPELFPISELALKRESMISRSWTSLYQQRPTPEGGGAFKKQDFRYFSRPESMEKTYALRDDDGTLLVPQDKCWRFITMDLAATKRTTSDWTVAAVWDVAPYLAPSRLILVHVERDRLEGAEHLDLVKKLWDTWHPSFIGIEEALHGSMTLAYSQRRGILVRPLKHRSKDKVFRAKDAELLCENHRVYFPVKASWLANWEHELLMFPNGTHDDQVDVFAYAAKELLAGMNLYRPPAEDPYRTPSIQERCLAQVRGSRKVPDHPMLGSQW